jgi:outer membrane immunogenic protein
MTLKTEYLYTDLGKTNLISADLGGATANLDRDFNFHTVRVGLNFKF